MPEYEIRFLNSDGTIALSCLTECVNDLDAEAVASELLNSDFAEVEIWQGLNPIPCRANLLLSA